MSASKLFVRFLCFALLCAFAFVSAPALATETYSSVPNLMHYQGRLATADGVNVDGEVSVQVFVYDSSTLGASGDPSDAHVLYAEDQGNVFVTRGTLRFTIGEGVPMGPFMGSPMPLEDLALAGELYVELYVNGERIEPRQRIGMRNAAMNAQYARKADNVSGAFGFNQSNLPLGGFSATKVTSGTINAARINNNVPSGKILGRISSNRLPSNIALSKISGGTLPTDVLPEFSADILTGTEAFPVSQLPTTILREDDIGFKRDTIDHGQLVTPVPGFNLGNCAWLVAYHNSNNSSSFNDINDFQIYPGDVLNPTVTCKIIKDASNQSDCQVDYVMICKN